MQLRDRLEADGDWLFRHRSYLPLLLIPVFIAGLMGLGWTRSGDAVLDAAACSVAALGILVRACVIGFAAPGTSGRNVRRQRAEVLNTTGVYSIVRHPLYLGNFLVVLGWSLATGNVWLVIITALLFLLYYERIALREEAFLHGRFGDAFTEWARRTPACLPRPQQWTAPSRHYRWGRLVRREYQTACAVVAGFVVVHLLRSVLVPADAAAAATWLAVGAADLALFLLAWLGMHWYSARRASLSNSGRI